MDLIIGSKGSIGAEISKSLSQQAIGSDHRGRSDFHLDLRHKTLPHHLPSREGGVAYLCAGISSTLFCRDNPLESRKINVDNTIELIHQLQARGMHIVFLSTTQVFNGSLPHHIESSPTSPPTAYGSQKVEVEQHLINQVGSGFSIIRLAKVLPLRFPLFEAWFSNWAQGLPVEPFSDHHFSALSMKTAISRILEIGRLRSDGIHHLGPRDGMTYETAARFLCQRLGISQSLIQPKTSPYGSTPLILLESTRSDTGKWAPPQTEASLNDQIMSWKSG